MFGDKKSVLLLVSALPITKLPLPYDYYMDIVCGLCCRGVRNDKMQLGLPILQARKSQVSSFSRWDPLTLLQL